MSEEKKLNIFQRLNNVRNEVNYLKRGSAGQGTGVLYDEVVALSREPMLQNGVMITTDFIADTSRSVTNNAGKESYIYEAFIRVWYINIDDPSDRFSTDIVAHAMDSGDKAPGKAVTYATKVSLVKVLFLETGTNDESRSANQDDYTDDQFGAYHDFIGEKDGMGLHMFLQCISEKAQVALHNSFERGKISKGKEEARELVSKGSKEYMELIETLNTMAKDEDPAITEQVDGLPDYARKMIGRMVKPETLKFLQDQIKAQK